MAWRVASSLERLLEEVNTVAPKRSKASDGAIGDAAHASRGSDHNPYIKDAQGVGVVRARDFTHDPKGGFDSYVFARSLAKSGDTRIRYIISNGQIWNPSVSRDWRNYTGSNPHDHHAHVSVSELASLYDDRRDWKWEGTPADMAGDRPVQPVPEEDYPLLQRGSKGDAVRTLQTLLDIVADGDFGPATERAVKAFQSGRGLGADGIVGLYTWKALRASSGPQSAPASSFARVMEYVFEDEGGLTVSADEPGGASFMGVSIDTLGGYLGRKATLTDLKAVSRATASDIYRKLFADPIGFDRLPAGLNYAAFDFAVNSGVATVDQKGLDDYLTRALREPNVAKQIDRLCDLRLERMRAHPQWLKYARGWSARVARVRSRAHAMAA